MLTRLGIRFLPTLPPAVPQLVPFNMIDPKQGRRSSVAAPVSAARHHQRHGPVVTAEHGDDRREEVEDQYAGEAEGGHGFQGNSATLLVAGAHALRDVPGYLADNDVMSGPGRWRWRTLPGPLDLAT